MRTSVQQTVEALTWISVVIWLGFVLVAHIQNYVLLVVLGLGIIMLGSAIYQRNQGWQTPLSIWIFGIWMAVFSMLELVGTLLSVINDGQGVAIDLWVYLGVVLVSLGMVDVLYGVNNLDELNDKRSGDGNRVDTMPEVNQSQPLSASAGWNSPAYHNNGQGSSVYEIPPMPPEQRLRSRRPSTYSLPEPRSGALDEIPDFKVRVDDIIQRSRQRRAQMDDDLPY